MKKKINMKKLLTIMMAVTITAGGAFGYAPGKGKGKDKSVVVIADRLDIFYFKVSKQMMGGLVEVFNENHELVATQSIDRKKMLLDFINAKPGIYSIQVKKDSIVREFHYQVVELESNIKVSDVPVAVNYKK